jgi:dienelactone hydrolase
VKIFTGLSALLLIVAATALPAHAELPDPETAGPYPVGVTTMLLTDDSRDSLVGDGPRRMIMEVWYPATEETRDLEPTDLYSFFRGVPGTAIAMVMKAAFGADYQAAAEAMDIVAVRDARIADGKYPLILFSHGNGGMRSQAIWWCEHMASHGYIVASPDHTGNAGVTIIDGKMIPIDPSLREASAEARPKDISFLIDTFEGFNSGHDSRFYERVDLKNIGVAGHSFGGYTTLKVADQDPRVDAICPWAGVVREREDYDTPLLMLIATEDDTIGEEANARLRTYYKESKGPKYSVEFVNAGHYSFTEMYRWNADFGDGVGEGTRITNDEPITYIGMDEAFRLLNGYTTAFFGKFLKGQGDYEAYLTENHNPEELIVLGPAKAKTAAGENEEGFVPIFNGTDLTGWTGDTGGYRAEDGVLHAKTPLGNLYTEKDYSDFVLRFEFKLSEGANNGIGIRVPEGGRASKKGMEIQILDNGADKFKDVKPWQKHGSIYGVVPAETGHLKPVGEWNTQEIVVDGPNIKVTLNDAVIVDADITPFREGQPAPDDKDHPGLNSTEGRISLAGHTTSMWFRNLRVKEF